MLDACIDVHPNDLTRDGLRERAWEKQQPRCLGRLAGLTDRGRAPGYCF